MRSLDKCKSLISLHDEISECLATIGDPTKDLNFVKNDNMFSRNLSILRDQAEKFSLLCCKTNNCDIYLLSALIKPIWN